MESYILWRYCKALGPPALQEWSEAMNASHNGMMFQHIVVNRNGLLTGKFHFDGTNLMQQLLERRRNSSSRNSIDIFRNIFWEPEVSSFIFYN
jgi:hypothetical protein